MKNKKTELIRSLKFLLFSISAGIIQLASYSLMFYVLKFEQYVWGHWVAYLVSLVLSVVWNFTFNRKYTFKSANNVPIAMLKVGLFYAVFTPVTTWANAVLSAVGVNNLLLEAGSMVFNFVTEYIYDFFVVFRGSIDSAVKEK